MTHRYDSSLFQEQRTTELAESTDKIANLEFELKEAQDKLSSFEVEKSNFAAIDDQRQLTIQNMEAQERFRFGLESRIYKRDSREPPFSHGRAKITRVTSRTLSNI